MKLTLCLSLSVLLGMAACTPDADESSMESVEAEKTVRLMTLNPGHFHAGLVHKYEYDQVDQTVHIYAPDGQELESHLALIDRFNSLDRIKSVRAPKLILHGERDRTVPVRLGRRLLDHAEEPKQGRFYAAAGHTDLHDHGAVEDIFQFLEEAGLGGRADRS